MRRRSAKRCGKGLFLLTRSIRLANENMLHNDREWFPKPSWEKVVEFDSAGSRVGTPGQKFFRLAIVLKRQIKHSPSKNSIQPRPKTIRVLGCSSKLKIR